MNQLHVFLVVLLIYAECNHMTNLNAILLVFYRHAILPLTLTLKKNAIYGGLNCVLNLDKFNNFRAVFTKLGGLFQEFCCIFL
jgi:hypothetical protein